MRGIKILLAFVLVLAFAGQATAQSTISFDSGYPKTGSGSGEIAVQGSISLACGWSLSGTTVTVSAWQEGCMVTCTTLSINSCTNTFTGSIGGLTSGVPYSVTVEVAVTKSGIPQTLQNSANGVNPK